MAATNVLAEIKKLIGSNSLIIGADLTLKNLKLGKVKRVFVTENAPDAVKEEIASFSKLSGAEVVDVNLPNEEMGVLCKKPFSISILSELKE